MNVCNHGYHTPEHCVFCSPEGKKQVSAGSAGGHVSFGAGSSQFVPTEALERLAKLDDVNRIKEKAEYLERVCGNLSNKIDKLENELDGLNGIKNIWGAVNELRGKVVNLEKQTSKDSDLATTSIDSNNKPSTFPFEVAMCFMRSGDKIKRAAWNHCTTLTGFNWNHISLDAEDVAASDWMLIKETA